MSERPRISVLRFRQLSTGRFYVPSDELDERRGGRERREPTACPLELTARAERLSDLARYPAAAEVVEPTNELLPLAARPNTSRRADSSRRGTHGARSSARRPRGRPGHGSRAVATRRPRPAILESPWSPRTSHRWRGTSARRNRILPARATDPLLLRRRLPVLVHGVAGGRGGRGRGRLEVEWLPFELRPAPKPLLEVRGDHLRTDWTQHVYRRALAAGVEIHLPRYQPRSTLPLAACLWAYDEGRLRAFKHALYEAFFCEGLDIATDAEIARAAEIVGLDPSAAVTAAYDPGLIERLRSIRRDAEAEGVAGVPTLLTDDGRTHWGMGGVERLLAGEPLVPRATG